MRSNSRNTTDQVRAVSGEVYALGAEGPVGRTRLPAGTLDGIAAAPDGRLFVASWEAAGLFVGRPPGPWKRLPWHLGTPADIAIDPRRGLLLIPLLAEDRVVVYRLPPDG